MAVLFALCLGFALGCLFCKLIDVIRENNKLKKDKNNKK